MSEDRVLQALKILAGNDRDREASPQVEARLLHEFRSRRARHGWRWRAIAAVAAGVMTAAFIGSSRGSKPAVRTSAPLISQAIETVPQTLPQKAAPVRRKVARKVVTVRRTEPHEVVTDFFPLMSPAPPFERGEMLRVQLPAAAMQAVGLPVREDHLADPVQADVLVGEEGMPRAIRFVRFDVQ